MLTNCKIISTNTPIADYIADPIPRGDKAYVMSRSQLMEVSLNPRRWLAGYREDTDDTKATTWGSLVDCLLLQPAQFEKCYAVTPAVYHSEVLKCQSCGSVTESVKCRACGCDREKVKIEKPWTKQSKSCQEWEASKEAEGKAIITSKAWEAATKAVMRLQNEPEVAVLLEGADFQVFVTGEWHDKETGLVVPVKALLDIVPGSKTVNAKCLADLKTSRSVNPRFWGKTVAEKGYHWQAALHFDLYCAASGEDRTDFLHVPQENYHPYEIMTPLPMMTLEDMQTGRNFYELALKKYCKCLLLPLDKWPGYEPIKTMFGRQICEMPAWAISQV